MSHFYAISRRDLPVHQQAIQSAHAQLSFAKKAPELIPDEHPPIRLANSGEQNGTFAALRHFGYF